MHDNQPYIRRHKKNNNEEIDTKIAMATQEEHEGALSSSLSASEKRPLEYWDFVPD